ncbi:MAG: hypothetical protein LBR64_10750 [Dysgonamonadaceae bacterium]|jgi:hypothetical protein|nr:hypothetical protein [Dysgonamonadaceae bacterium]
MNEIIENINERILAGINCLKGSIPVRAFGLAKPVNLIDDSIDGSLPAIIDNEGECYYVFTDDEYPLGFYHRLISRTYGKQKGYGDNDLDAQTDELIIVVWGLSKQLEMQAEEVEREIIIPAIPAKAVPVQSNFDAKTVCQTEWRGYNYINKPEEFIFSTRYRISTVFNRKCREIKC